MNLYDQIPNNVNLSEDKKLQRALEKWLPNFLDWWREMGPEGFQEKDVWLRTAIDVGSEGWANRRAIMGNQAIREHMEVIGADGVHVGTVDKVEGGRIKLTKKDSGEGSHKGHHHFISLGLVADIDGGKVRLSANGDVAVTFEEEQGG